MIAERVRRATGQGWLGLAEGVPQARYEAVLAVLRGSLCLISAALLLISARSELAFPAAVFSVLAVASLLAALKLSRIQDPATALRAGRWSTVADVAVFASYSAAFANRPGAGATYGIFVLLMGPVRYGWRGALATGVPVALIAIAWPQKDAAGAVLPLVQVLTVCGLFTIPALVVRAVVNGGSARLRQAEQQFATAFDYASIGMALVDQELQVLQANRSLGALLGVTPVELVGTGLAARVDPEDQQRLQNSIAGLRAAAPNTRLEVRVRQPDGGLRWGSVSASLLAGGSGLTPRIVVEVENITERKRAEAALSHAAAHDALTDLPNRAMLLARLDSALTQGERVGVLFLDLDRFKVVNDGLGHAAGDQLLVQIATRLLEAMRPDDMVARIGGDEFVVLCRNADLTITSLVAARVLEVLARPVPGPHGADVVVGTSVGAALAGPGDTAEAVLENADTAMYAAKAAGGGRVHQFSPDLRAAVLRWHELETELRAAVRSEGLSLVYQPIIDVALGRVLGCEALVRWQHPTRGQLPPQEFINIAEQSDLILELGDWVLRRALADAATWLDRRGTAPTLSVNVSIRQLLAPGFAAQVRARLLEAGVPAGRLCLEVTETVLAGEVEPVIQALESLRAVGVHLSIDDFGTGHASLTYLARFPVDQVKVDRSFVAGLGSDAGSAAIVGGVIAMAHTFDLRVVAEGVETEIQLEALRALRCDGVQGFLLSVPTTPEGIALMIHSQSAGPLVPWPRRGDAPMAATESTYDEVSSYRLLVEGALAVTGRLDLDAVLEHACAALAHKVSFTGGSILLVEDGQVRIGAARPAPTAAALTARTPLGQGVTGTIAATGWPRYLPDITIASTVPLECRRTAAATGVRSWFGVPLIAEGQPIGVLQIDSTGVDAFGEQERLALLSFAPVVALAVISARHAAAQLQAIQDS